MNREQELFKQYITEQGGSPVFEVGETGDGFPYFRREDGELTIMGPLDYQRMLEKARKQGES